MRRRKKSAKLAEKIFSTNGVRMRRRKKSAKFLYLLSGIFFFHPNIYEKKADFFRLRIIITGKWRQINILCKKNGGKISAKISAKCKFFPPNVNFFRQNFYSAGASHLTPKKALDLFLSFVLS